MQIAKKILFILWMVTIVAFLLCPTRVPFRIETYCIIFCSYLLSLLLFFFIKKKSNYFDFDVIFLVMTSLMFFLSPFFANNEIFSRLFIVGFDSKLLFKGSLLASVGLQSYMVGGTMKYKTANRLYNCSFPKSNVFAQYFLVCSALFIVSGGIDFYKSMYNSDYSQNISSSGLIQQMIPLMVVFSNLYCVSVFTRIRDKKSVNWQYLAYIFTFSFVLAVVGNRTLFSNIILPYVICYFSYIKNISWRKTLLLFMIGIIFMSIIQITRTGDSYYSRSFVLMFTDMTIPSSTLYNTLEYVDIYGITNFKTMLAPLIGCIPGLGSMFTNIEGYSSASVLTNYMVTESWMEGIGMGSTIIGDLYLGGGVIGVVIFMVLLGRWINILFDKKDINSMVIECSFYSSCIFMCRSSYFYPARFIIWSLLIVYIYNLMVKSYGKN